MTKFKYIEMIEEVDDPITQIPNIIRLDVVDDAEAEQIYADNKNKFTKLNAKVVDGEHFADSKLNKPCVARKIKEDGTIEVL
jgi:hypothetical protein